MTFLPLWGGALCDVYAFSIEQKSLGGRRARAPALRRRRLNKLNDDVSAQANAGETISHSGTFFGSIRRAGCYAEVKRDAIAAGASTLFAYMNLDIRQLEGTAKLRPGSLMLVGSFTQCRPSVCHLPSGALLSLPLSRVFTQMLYPASPDGHRSVLV